jgi:apolipoprotein N-acyltransferase
VGAFPGFDAWPLGFVAFVPLAAALRAQPPGRAAALGWLWGTLTALAGFYWLLPMLARYSGFPAPLCALLLLALSLFQGGRGAALAWLLARAARNGWPQRLAWIASFVASEALYPLLFPWYFGAVLHNQPLLLQIADLGGPIAVGALLLSVNLAASCALEAIATRSVGPLRFAAVAALFFLASLAYGALRIRATTNTLETAPSVRVGLVQGNVPMTIHGAGEHAAAFRRHLALTRSAIDQGAELVVWSESAFGYVVPERDAERFLGDSFTRRTGVPMLFGALVERGEPGRGAVFNSAIMTDRNGGVVGRYDKHHLLAFGEYLPFGDLVPWLYELSPASGRITPGTSLGPVPLAEARVTVLVCYEDILPGFVRAAVRLGRPNLLVNLTNDAWFGESLEPAMHLGLAKLRAVEHHRFLIRATNSGISTIIDPSGRTVASAAPFREAMLPGTVRLLEGGGTVYGQVGDAPWYALSAAVALGAFVSRRRRAAS